MKQKDIILVIVAVFVAAVFALILSRLLFSTPKNRETRVEVVQPISADFPEPDPKFFNSKAVNPTKLIQIGENQNTQPFGAQ